MTAERGKLGAAVPVRRAVPRRDGDRSGVRDVAVGGEEARMARLERDHLAAVRLQHGKVVRADDPVADDPVLEDAVGQLERYDVARLELVLIVREMRAGGTGGRARPLRRAFARRGSGTARTA